MCLVLPLYQTLGKDKDSQTHRHTNTLWDNQFDCVNPDTTQNAPWTCKCTWMHHLFSEMQMFHHLCYFVIVQYLSASSSLAIFLLASAFSFSISLLLAKTWQRWRKREGGRGVSEFNRRHNQTSLRKALLPVTLCIWSCLYYHPVKRTETIWGPLTLDLWQLQYMGSLRYYTTRI